MIYCIIDAGDTDLILEKLYSVNYDSTLGEFTAAFDTADDMHRFARLYGAYLFVPPDVLYEHSRLVFQQGDEL